MLLIIVFGNKDCKVRRHNVGGVLLAAKAGFDERKARLHEDDECGTNDHPKEVQADADVGWIADWGVWTISGISGIRTEYDNGAGDASQNGQTTPSAESHEKQPPTAVSDDLQSE